MRTMRTEPHRQDEGLIAVLFALVVVVVIGAGALIVDMGLSYAEGRQLQNGAENAALVVARDCALSESGCSSSTAAGALAGTWASSNALDGTSAVTGGTVCGRNISTLDDCTSTASSAPERLRYDCRPSSLTAPYVEVRTQTRRVDGATFLPPILSRVLEGDSPQTTVRACARAVFGSPKGLADLLPMAMPACAWQEATKGGTVYPDPGPPLGLWPSPSPEVIYYFHGKAPPAPGCKDVKYPGKFSWLGDTDGDGDPCKETTTMPDELRASSGLDAVLCNNRYEGDADGDPPKLAGSVILVPVFDGVVDPAAKPLEYKGVSYAAFYVSGYRFSGSVYDHVNGKSNKVPCQGDERCLSGWFVEAIAPDAAELGPLTDMGVSVVRLSG